MIRRRSRVEYTDGPSVQAAAPPEQSDVTKAVLAARKLKRELADAEASKKKAADAVRLFVCGGEGGAHAGCFPLFQCAIIFLGKRVLSPGTDPQGPSSCLGTRHQAGLFRGSHRVCPLPAPVCLDCFLPVFQVPHADEPIACDVILARALSHSQAKGTPREKALANLRHNTGTNASTGSPRPRVHASVSAPVTKASPPKAEPVPLSPSKVAEVCSHAALGCKEPEWVGGWGGCRGGGWVIFGRPRAISNFGCPHSVLTDPLFSRTRRRQCFRKRPR